MLLHLSLIVLINFYCSNTGRSAGTGGCRKRSSERDSGIVQVSRGREEEGTGITGAGETTRSCGEGERRIGCHLGNGYVCVRIRVCLCVYVCVCVCVRIV